MTFLYVFFSSLTSFSYNAELVVLKSLKYKALDVLS